MKQFMAVCLMFAAIGMTAQAVTIADGSLTAGQNQFPTNGFYSNLDLSGGETVLSGTIDLSAAPVAAEGTSSAYYFFINFVDSSNNTLRLTMNNDWLGSWRGIPAQPWDRTRLEYKSGSLIGGPELYFSTLGGQTDDGGGYIVASDRTYDFELTIDSAAKTMSLDVYALGRSNSTEKQWYDVGTMDLSGYSFDYTQANLSAALWNGGSESATVAWSNVSVVPEPATLALLGLGGVWLRRRK